MTYDFGCKNTPRQNQATSSGHWFQELAQELVKSCIAQLVLPKQEEICCDCNMSRLSNSSKRKYVVIAACPGCAIQAGGNML